MAKLGRSNIDASAGAKEEVARIVAQIRQRWPGVKIILRADPGFARDDLVAWVEANQVHDLFGLVRNSRPVAHIHVALAWAEEDALKTGQPARRFADFRWTTRDSWSRRRRAVAKAEWMAGRGDKGANLRFVVTSLKPKDYDARTLYEERDCARGDRERVAPGFAPHRGLPARPLRRSHLRLPTCGPIGSAPVRLLRLCPSAALRRIALPHTQLARATCATLRNKRLKIGAQITRSVRRIRIAMASACPYEDEVPIARARLCP